MSRRSDYAKEKYQQRVADHQCVHCGSLLKDTFTRRCRPCLDKSNAAARRWNERKLLAGLCPQCGGQRDSNTQSCTSCLAKVSESLHKLGIRNRQKVFTHYGAKCACCGESEQSFLTIDHINGDGAAQRRNARLTAGKNYYRYIIQQGFPDDLQLLCWNCNMSKHYLGQCPHQAVAPS